MFNSLIEPIKIWGYPAVFAGGFVEGLNVTIAGGFFAAHGFFSLAGVFLASASGNYLSDIMWYRLGKRYGFRIFTKARSLLPFVKITDTENDMEKIKMFINRHGRKALMLAKFTIGPGIATQIISGAANMPFNVFAKYSLLANIVFTAAMLAVGYGFGESYQALARVMRNAGILVFVFVIFIIVFEYFGGRRVLAYFKSARE